MRQAYLIIAHNEFGILQKLVSSLDDASIDIYIHIDNKVEDLPKIRTKYSKVFMLKKRVNVTWGTVSQIKTELLLMENARKNGPYDFYHIISGTHLPLVSMLEINSFYSMYIGQEVMHIWPEDPGDADFKLRRFHLFKKVNWLWKLSLKIQKALNIRQLEKEHFVKTDNWISISEKACKYLTHEKDSIIKKYRWSHCGDEYFAATELVNAGGFYIHDYPYLLHVVFDGANPISFSTDQIEGLRASNCLWARKFHE